MPTTTQLVFTIAVTVVIANFMWWTLWRHYRPNGMFGAGPRFTHDCDNCRYIGRYDLTYREARERFLHKREAWRLRRHDLYLCNTECFGINGQTTYIEYVARRGDDGPEYLATGADYIANPENLHPALAECLRLAKES